MFLSVAIGCCIELRQESLKIIYDKLGGNQNNLLPVGVAEAYTSWYRVSWHYSNGLITPQVTDNGEVIGNETE